MYKLEEKYCNIPKEHKEEIKRLNALFFPPEGDNNNPLRGGKILPKDERKINELWFRYVAPLKNRDWGYDFLKVELDDMRKDGFCSRNTNKGLWAKCYMLNWLLDLPVEGTADFFFRSLRSRLVYQMLVKLLYTKVEAENV